jgi:hypothetical protein
VPTTTPASYQVRVTYKSEAQAPPPGNTATTAFVSSITTANSVAGSDAVDTTVTLNNQTPAAGATWGANAAGDGQVFLAWSRGSPGNEALVVRYTPTPTPRSRRRHDLRAQRPFGSRHGALRGRRPDVHATTPWRTGRPTTTESRARRLPQLRGQRRHAPWSSVLTPKATTTVGNGVPAANATVCPGAANQKLDGFSLVNSQGNTPVTALTSPPPLPGHPVHLRLDEGGRRST